MKKQILFISIISLLLVIPAAAQTTAFNYQGSLSTSGSPATGNYDFEFALFDSLSGGTQLGSTLTRSPVAVANGTFAVSLDFGSQFPGANRFLEIRVRLTGDPGGYQQLLPRSPVNSAPYSVKTLIADNATNATTATTATNATQLGGQAASFYQNATNMSAGTLDAARLPVPLSLTGAAAGNGIISGTNSSTSGRGVVGEATAASGNTYGGRFTSASTSGHGVYGSATAATGETYGGEFRSTSTTGIGVYGWASATTGDNYGVLGQSLSPSGYGVYGTSTDNIGVFGIASGISGVNYGGRFESSSASGRGVFAIANASSGLNYGVLGSTNSPDGYGGYFVGRGYFSGNVGLGVAIPTFRLHLSTDSAAKPTSSGWTISSDQRLKKNIRPIESALDKLMDLRGVTYQWRDPASQGDMAGTYTGMIAQDVEKVFPEWIRDDANGFKTLTVIGFEGIVVEALRQLRAEKDAEISSQQNQLEAQDAKIRSLEMQVEALKALVCSQNPAADACRPKN